MQKALAITLSGTIILAFSEMVLAVVTGLLTQHDTSIEFMQGIVSFKEDFFVDNPMLYFILVFASHIIYYFCFLIFAIGITSFLKNKMAVIVVPFIIVGALDMMLPTALQPNVVMRPYYRSFSIGGYGILISAYFIENDTQFENLKYLAQINNRINDEDIKAALEMVGLDTGNHEKVKNFSLGMRQRLAIAQAIMENQKIIILDEPFNGLDKQGAAQIKQLLLGLKSPDRLILLTSHISGDIEELSDHIFEFSAGKIIPASL